MSENLSDRLLDALVERSVALLRFDASQRRDVARLLYTLQTEILARMVKGDISEAKRAQLQRILSDVSKLIGETYTTIAAQQADAAFALMQAEAVYIVSGLNKIIGADLLGGLASDATIKALVGELLIQGAPSADWWSRQADDMAFRFAAEMRIGIAENETITELTRRVRGNPAKGIVGIMPISRRNAEALVRSSVATVANAAREAVYQANADVIAGVQQISTLDGRTTAICVAYSGACWDLNHKPIRGTRLPFNGGPPRHWNCRSTLLPIVKSFRELGMNVDLPAATRASMNGQVAGDLSFADWLQGKGKDFQDDLLGKGRADLWRNGKITLQQLLDGSGRELTLEELHARFGG